METVKTAVAEIKSRGQLTIPKKIRDISHLEEGQVVSIIPVGDSVIITPKRLELEEARRQIRRIIKASGLSEEELLTGLKEEREKLYKETYGKKREFRLYLEYYRHNHRPPIHCTSEVFLQGASQSCLQ
jgi:AbrB family looped-hinge helix DNA binding protein